LYLIVVAKNAHAQLNFDVLKSFSNHVENEKRKQVEASTEAEYGSISFFGRAVETLAFS